jgi:SAM-dependent methyltransferase
MEQIHETGFWKKEYAEPHHIHSPNLSAWICNFLKDKKENLIYDFGCGMGNYLNDLHKNGFTKLIGIEAEPPKNDYDFQILSKNLAHPFQLEKKGIIISLEVGEHIPKEYQNDFLNNISFNCSEYLIMSWAVRNQGGWGHYNELDNHEILPEIINRGFTFMEDESNEVRGVIEDSCSWFRNTLMIFKK